MKQQFLFFILLLFTLKAVAGDGQKQTIDSLLNKANKKTLSRKKAVFTIQLEPVHFRG